MLKSIAVVLGSYLLLVLLFLHQTRCSRSSRAIL